jgi:hypothetical protein
MKAPGNGGLMFRLVIVMLDRRGDIAFTPDAVT